MNGYDIIPMTNVLL